MSEKVIGELSKEPLQYGIKAYCGNCGWRGDLRFNRGEPVKTNMVNEISNRYCPKCDCHSLHKG